jgi:HAD superfamily hydrolase (TIGR01509 family)
MKIINPSIRTAALCFLINLQVCVGLSVIFDLNGVLFTTNTSIAFWHLGPTRLAYYYVLYGRKPYHLKTRLYETLNILAPDDQTSIHDDDGIPMPLLMRRWLMGTVEGKIILNDIAHYMAKRPEAFSNSIERDLINRLAQIIFDPSIFVATRAVIWEGIRFVQQCKKDGHQVYVLSNWDPLSFGLLYDQYKNIFDQFDGIVISGTKQDMKPSPAIFKKLLFLYDLGPDTCIFIDDQQENLDAAVSLGIKTILCSSTGYPLKKPDFDVIRQSYKQYTRTLIVLNESIL